MKKWEEEQAYKPENCNGQIHYRIVVDTWRIMIYWGRADMDSVKHSLTASLELCGEVKSCMEMPAAVEVVHLSSQKALDKVRHQAPLRSHSIREALECSSVCVLRGGAQRWLRLMMILAQGNKDKGRVWRTAENPLWR